MHATDECTALPADTAETNEQRVKLQGVQYAVKAKKEGHIPLLSGYGISADIAGAGLAMVGKWGWSTSWSAPSFLSNRRVGNWKVKLYR